MQSLNVQRPNTRQKIINAALLVAAKEGFSRATTDQIAKKAGVSEGIIYHYFKSKYDLCCDMIREKAEEFRHRLLGEIEGCAAADEKLDKLIGFHFDYFTSKDSIFKAIFGKSGDTTIMMSQVLKVAIIPYLKIVEGIIKAGIREGDFKDVNSGIAASSLLGMMQASTIRLHFGFADFSIKEAKELIARIFLEGIRKKR